MRIDFALGSNFKNKDWEFNSHRRGGNKNKKMRMSEFTFLLLNKIKKIFIFTLFKY